MLYPFLSAVLPALDPAVPTELTVEKFDGMMKEELSAKLFDAMTSIDREAAEYPVPIYNELNRFKAHLHYRIAKARAEKLHFQNNFEIPDELYGEVDFAVANAVNASPLEREKLIDLAVWRKLDDLEICHELDFEHLCIYRLRLQMLQKYSMRSEENGKNNFEAALDHLSGKFNEP